MPNIPGMNGRGIVDLPVMQQPQEPEILVLFTKPMFLVAPIARTEDGTVTALELVFSTPHTGHTHYKFMVDRLSARSIINMIERVLGNDKSETI